MKQTLLFNSRYGYGKESDLSPITKVEGLFFDNQQVYQFSDPIKMPQTRYQMCLEFYNDMEVGLDAESLVKVSNEIKRANNSGKTSDVGYWAEILTQMATKSPLDSMYKFACAFFFTANENPMYFDADYNELKYKEFRQMTDRLFFWRKLNMPLKELGIISPKDTLVSLQSNQRKMDVYKKVLNEVVDYYESETT